jgi:hypothetical protein
VPWVVAWARLWPEELAILMLNGGPFSDAPRGTPVAINGARTAMRTFHIVIATLLFSASFAGCEDHKHARRETPDLVPSTAIIQTAVRDDRPLPGQVLPASDADFYVPRYQPFAWGMDYSNYYSYIRIYDSQSLSIPNTGTYGYRYRYIIQPLP